MSKDRFVAVSEVEPPDFDVPVRWPRHQQCAVVGDIHTGDRELVSIQRQEKLHKVNVLVLIKRIYFQQEKHQGTWYQERKLLYLWTPGLLPCCLIITGNDKKAMQIRQNYTYMYR